MFPGSRVDGQTSPEELSLATGLDDLQTWEIVQRLRDPGIVISAGAPRLAQPAAPLRGDGRARAGRAGSATAPASIRATCRRSYALRSTSCTRLSEMDLFHILGCEPGAARRELWRAYAERARVYHRPVFWRNLGNYGAAPERIRAGERRLSPPGRPAARCLYEREGAAGTHATRRQGPVARPPASSAAPASTNSLRGAGGPWPAEARGAGSARTPDAQELARLGSIRRAPSHLRATARRSAGPPSAARRASPTGELPAPRPEARRRPAAPSPRLPTTTSTARGCASRASDVSAWRRAPCESSLASGVLSSGARAAPGGRQRRRPEPPQPRRHLSIPRGQEYADRLSELLPSVADGQAAELARRAEFEEQAARLDDAAALRARAAEARPRAPYHCRASVGGLPCHRRFESGGGACYQGDGNRAGGAACAPISLWHARTRGRSGLTGRGPIEKGARDRLGSEPAHELLETDRPKK